MESSLLIYTPRVLLGELLKGALVRSFSPGPVMCVRSCQDFVAAARRRPWALLMIDTACPRDEAFRAVDQLRRRRRDVRILFFAERVTLGWMSKAVQVRAAAFLGGCATLDDLKRAVRAALNGQTYFTPCAVEALNLFARGERRAPSPRDLTVLSLIAGGSSSKEASRVLGISPKGVDAIRARLMRRLGARSSAALVRRAYDERLIDVAHECACPRESCHVGRSDMAGSR